MELLIASNNPNKIRELKEILGDRFETFSLKEKGIISDPEETGETFEENSEIKARFALEKSGIATLADDSGLAVEALNGEPGVFSARYSGEDATTEKNNALLLKNMENITDRRAKFVCVITLLFPDGRKIQAKGECHGEILLSPRGTNGFGYDPLFYVPEYKKTFAELTAEEKNAISHRAVALRAFEERLKNIDND